MLGLMCVFTLRLMCVFMLGLMYISKPVQTQLSCGRSCHRSLFRLPHLNLPPQSRHIPLHNDELSDCARGHGGECFVCGDGGLPTRIHAAMSMVGSCICCTSHVSDVSNAVRISARSARSARSADTRSADTSRRRRGSRKNQPMPRNQPMPFSMPIHQRRDEDVPLVLGELFGGELRLRSRLCLRVD